MDYQNKILNLENLYKDLENKIQFFKQKTHLDCVPGCGDCCNRFEPYISVLEGIIIADWLYRNQEAMDAFGQKMKNKSEILCPFYQVGSNYHCGIYTIRPFICRLFAFSGKRQGSETKYCPCLRIQGQYPEETRIAQQYVSQGLILPIYNEEFSKICKIDFLLATDLHPLTRSIEIALEIFFLNRNIAEEKASLYHNTFTFLVRKTLEKTPPPDNTPPPRLSA